MQSHNNPSSILTAYCEMDLRQIDAVDVIQDLAANQDAFEALFKSYEWFIHYSSNLKVKSLQESSSSSSAPLLRGWDITLFKVILEKLSLAENNKEQALRSAIFIYYGVKIEPGKNYNYYIVNFLEAAGLLPALRYVVCISLLTGGLNSAELELNVLVKLLNDANLTFEEILGKEPVFSHLQMAMQADDPAILLTALNVKKFKFENLNISFQVHQSLLAYAIHSKKINILVQMINDLSAENILKIKCINELLSLQNPEVTQAIKNKISEEVLQANSIKLINIEKLLYSMKTHLEKYVLLNDYPEKWRDYTKDLLTAVVTEIKRPCYDLYEGIYNSYCILMEDLYKPIVEKLLSSSSSSSSHADVHCTMMQEISIALMDMSKVKLKQTTREFEASLDLYPKNIEQTWDCFSQWVDVAIDYQTISNSKKSHYSINFAESHKALIFVLERIQISLMAYRLELRNLPDFIQDMNQLHYVHRLEKNKGTLIAFLDSISHKFFAFLKVVLIAEAKKSYADVAAQGSTVEQLRKISRLWAVYPLQQDDRDAQVDQINFVIRDKLNNLL
ncbi:MAG: hypothetical protein P4M12_07840 [Gammaproteobacteria bacterium]|nr:hypothetical protein [Gammaproteobacteria bacterium]